MSHATLSKWREHRHSCTPLWVRSELGSLKIVFNRNGQWLAVIRGHYRVARECTGPPTNLNQPFEKAGAPAASPHPRIRRGGPPPLMGSLASFTAIATVLQSPWPPSSLILGERNESEPNPSAVTARANTIRAVPRNGYVSAPFLFAAKARHGFIWSFSVFSWIYLQYSKSTETLEAVFDI